MVNKYHLVNPYIDGDFEASVTARNSNEAANMLYSRLSEHFNNTVPKFYFTIQKGSSSEGKYYHFQVKENRKQNQVNFKISPFEVNDESITTFKSKLDNYISKKQDGGKKSKKSHKKKREESEDSDSDFSSSESNYYLRSKHNTLSQPFYYWWYDPYLYNINSVYIPTFYSYVTPLIELAVLPMWPLA